MKKTELSTKLEALEISKLSHAYKVANDLAKGTNVSEMIRKKGTKTIVQVESGTKRAQYVTDITTTLKGLGVLTKVVWFGCNAEGVFHSGIVIETVLS